MPRSLNRVSFSHLYPYREVLYMLIRREWKARYAQTWLGAVWVVFQPLFTIGIFSIIFGKWAHLPAEGVPYTLFTFSGMIPWVFFSQGIQRSAMSFHLESRLITKVYFPRLLIPLSSLLVTLMDVALLLGLFSLLLAMQGMAFSYQALFFPLLLLPLFALTLGVSAMISSFVVYYRDVLALLPLALQTLLYLSPILYSISLVPPEWLVSYELNPLVGLIEGVRWSLLSQDSFPVKSFILGSTLSIGIAFLGVTIFGRLERNFADII